MALLSKAVSHWRLDEAALNDRVDSIGSFTMTEEGDDSADGIATAAGQVTANAVDFQGDGDPSEFLEGPNSTTFRVGDQAFVWAGWVYFDDLTINQRVFAKWHSVLGREFVIHYNQAADRIRLTLRNSDDAGNTNVDGNSFGSPSTGQWIFILAGHDPDSDLGFIRINGGTKDTGAFTGGVQTTTQLTVTTMGSLGTNAGTLEDPGSALNGRMNSWTVFNQLLTPTEENNLHNNGMGLDHPFPEPGDGMAARSSIWVPPFVHIP